MRNRADGLYEDAGFGMFGKSFETMHPTTTRRSV